MSKMLRKFVETSRAKAEQRAVERYIEQAPTHSARLEIEAVMARRRVVK